MCITVPNRAVLEVNEFAMHTQVPNSNTPSEVSQKERKSSRHNVTVVCTHCKRVCARPSDLSIRISKEKEDDWIAVEDISQTTHALSHGLCITCFNNINAKFSTPINPSPSSSPASSPASAFPDLYSPSSSPSTPAPSFSSSSAPKRSFFPKSRSSPQITRHVSPPPPSVSTSSPIPPPTRILVVDDNRLQRHVHKRMVEQCGYKCDVAHSGARAMEMLQKNRYDVVLLDLVMSPMDGWDTARSIRSAFSFSPLPSSSLSHSFTSLPTLHTPRRASLSSSCTLPYNLTTHTPNTPRIIAVTGLHVDEKLNTKCKEAGMDDVVQKPLSQITLDKILTKCTKSEKIDR